MKNKLMFLLWLVIANASQANSIDGVPSFAVECPGKILVQADQDGPVLINNKEADTKIISERRFEAKGSGLTLFIVFDVDNSVTVTSTGKAPNGVCLSVDD